MKCYALFSIEKYDNLKMFKSFLLNFYRNDNVIPTRCSKASNRFKNAIFDSDGFRGCSEVEINFNMPHRA